MASIIPVKANENKAVLKRIDTLKSYISYYDPEMMARFRPDATLPQSVHRQKLQNAQAAIRSLEKDVQILDKARENRRFWLDELAVVNDARPAAGGIWFSGVKTTHLKQPGAGGGGGGGGGRRRRAPRSRGDDQMEVPTGSGFPGLAAPSGGGGGGEGRRGPRRRGGGGGGGNKAIEVPVPNGLVINGFAESDETIKEFVAALKGRERTTPNGQIVRIRGVFFSEASVKKVPWDILYNAPAEGAGSSSSRSSAGGGAYNPAYDTSLYSFTVVVRFLRAYPGNLGGAANQPGNVPST